MSAAVPQPSALSEPTTLTEMHRRVVEARARMERAGCRPRQEKRHEIDHGCPARRAEARKKRKAYISGRTAPRDVIARVAERYGLEYEDIVSKTWTTQRATQIRVEALSELRHVYPERSLPWLAGHMGRDHTTVLHHLQMAGTRFDEKLAEAER